VIVRARQKGGSKSESTIKLRAKQPLPEVEEKWKGKPGFKTEVEWMIGEGEAISYSLEHEIGDLERLEKGSPKIGNLFSDEQRAFFKDITDTELQAETVEVFGEIKAKAWQWQENDPAVDDKVTAELWEIPGNRVFELSRECKADNLEKKAKKFEKFFEKKGITSDTNAESKTRKALEYFSKQNKTAASQGADQWHHVGDGILMGISGMALLERANDRASFLVVHDNKKPDQDRAGVVTVEAGKEPKYEQLVWPGEEPPKDLEALAAVPGRKSEYVAATSKGKACWIKADASKGVEVIKVFQIPGATEKSEIESFDLQKLGDVIVAAWADRGDGEEPAVLTWSKFDPETNEFSETHSTEIHVPWPEKEARDVSDLKIDQAGVVFISSAFDGGDDGPFASAVYTAGAFHSEGGEIRFAQNPALTRLYHFEGRKIEALELVPGRGGGIIFGTDDENLGSAVYFSW
jgi:hypothetical protein